ncbi:arylacetamide deacetylase-like 2 [Dipodomys merriami]|uniref:arylacetamide deacetylase-like 2 n=1 Tax=Dipodomys merriami TaxID=94247 RepID=UPI003855AA15
MGHKTLYFGLFCIFLAYYIYIPIPEGIEEPWEVQLLDASMKMISLTAMLLENTGIITYEEFYLTISSVLLTRPESDGNLTVLDTDFGGVPVRLYVPTGAAEHRSYRLAPQYHFPVPLEDCISAVKFFLQDEILRQDGVDSARVCISGDSSGGVLAAQVVQAPMYIYLSHLSFLDLCYTTTMVPQILLNMGSSKKTISYRGCSVQYAIFHKLGDTE